MARNKWDKAKCTVLPLPFLLLGAWLVDLPFLLPAFCLPERLYLALDSKSGAADILAARGGAGEAFAVLDSGLLPLPSPASDPSSYDEIASRLPDFPPTLPVVADIEAGLPPLRRARLVSSSALAVEELASLQKSAAASGLPLAIETLPGPEPGLLPIESLSWRCEPKAESLSFELLLRPEARGLDLIEILPGAAAGDAAAGDRGIWRGSGMDLPADLVLRLSARKESLAQGIIARAEKGGRREELALGFGGRLEGKPAVLVITERQGGTSFIEKLYDTERLSPAEAAGRDFRSYELVVVDGMALGKIRGPLLGKLLEAQRQKYASILFAADSPDFGKKGDCPELEELLPVSLRPKSLKDLPDLALLILLDTSGSMFGDKLSLAKVTGLELLKGLKPTDRVGMMLFSDRKSWTYDFTENSRIKAAPLLDPVPAQGGTDLASALEEGLERLRSLPLRERHAVIVSDGVTKPADFSALAAMARREGVTISTMGLGADCNRSLLERMAVETGGRFYMVSKAEEIPSLLFEDRMDEARPPFTQEPVSIFNLNGDRVAEVGGMALYSAGQAATVLFADKLGDPLLASREYGNRAVLLFASDLYGGYTSDFFSRRETAGVFRDRLDALFAESPIEVSLLEDGRSLNIFLKSDALAAPRLVLSSEGRRDLESSLSQTAPGLWTARIFPSWAGEYTASIMDRGARLSSFAVSANSGIAGMELADAQAYEGRKALAFRSFHASGLWLLLFFAASLGSTLLLRYKK